MPTIPTKLRVQATQKTKNNSNLYRYQINTKWNIWRLSERSILKISGADAKRWFTEVFTRHLFCNSDNIDRFSSYFVLRSKFPKEKLERMRKKTLAPFSKPDLALTHPLTYAIRTSTHDTDSDTTTRTHTRPPRLRRPPPVASRARPASRTHGQIAS